IVMNLKKLSVKKCLQFNSSMNRREFINLLGNTAIVGGAGTLLFESGARVGAELKAQYAADGLEAVTIYGQCGVSNLQGRVDLNQCLQEPFTRKFFNKRELFLTEIR